MLWHHKPIICEAPITNWINSPHKIPSSTAHLFHPYYFQIILNLTGEVGTRCNHIMSLRYWFINLPTTIATVPQPASFLLTIPHPSQSNHTLSLISHFNFQSMTILSCSYYYNTLNPASNCPLTFYRPMRVLLNTISTTKAIPIHSPYSLRLWKPV